MARFTSTDPVREYANPYAYVGWKPTALVDPTGMSSFPCVGMGDVMMSNGFEQLRDRLEPGNSGYTGPHGDGWSGIRPGEFSQSAAGGVGAVDPAGESSPSTVDPSGRVESVSVVEIIKMISALLPQVRAPRTAMSVAGKAMQSVARSAAVKADLDALSAAASKPFRNGLSQAGHHLAKHGGRQGSVFPAASGNPSQISRQGQAVVDDILTTPGSTSISRHHARFGDVLEVRAPDGRGVRFDAGNNFKGFLEPGK